MRINFCQTKGSWITSTAHAKRAGRAHRGTERWARGAWDSQAQARLYTCLCVFVF